MRRGGSVRSPIFVLLSLSFATGILTAVFLPDLLIIVILTAILMFLCLLLIK